MKRFRAAIGLLALLLACAWAAPAWAADPVGIMEVQQGSVKLRRGQQEQIYRATDQRVALYVGDALQSAKDSRGKLTFEQGNQEVSLYADTFFRVEDVKPVRSLFRLAVGKAIFAVLKLTGAQQFQVRTPTAVIGVKGTEFVVGSDGGAKTFLLTVNGTVAMASVDFPDREVLVTQDQASFSTKGEAPTEPVVVTPEVRENIKSEDTLDTFQHVESTTPEATQREKKREQEKQQQQKTEAQPQPLPQDLSVLSEVRQAVEQVRETRQAAKETIKAAEEKPPETERKVTIGIKR